MCTRAVELYLAGQLGHMSGQSDVWTVNQGASTAGLFTRLFTVANLKDGRPNVIRTGFHKLMTNTVALPASY